MQEPMLRLNGVNENLQIRVETSLRGADSPEKVIQALVGLFPEFSVSDEILNPQLGSASNTELSNEGVSLETFLKKLHEQRILDTALDSMSLLLENNQTKFRLSRQAAIVGKVAFPLPNEEPLGGVITVTLSGEHLSDWLVAATWHKGRDVIPRSIADESAMDSDGDAVTWI
ncbi:MAG: RNA-binding domain-containing protein [Candidatus Poseidoniaceae archaeon]|jgi:predicted RNA binding protein with dsRBD fold (UPF0201 family)|nr:RNA-binding domain-containing protein [Candidatus Poseidoniaceae archaeon]